MFNRKNYMKIYNKKYRDANKNKLSAMHKQYYKINKDKMLLSMKEHRENKKNIYAITRKKWGENNKEYVSRKNKEWYEKHKNEYNKKRREQYQKNPPIWSTYQYRKDYLKKWQRNKRKKDLLYKINSNISRRLRKDLKRFNITKKESTQTMVQYSMADLKTHIEKQFNKYLFQTLFQCNWEIENSTPLSWATSENDIYNLWDLKNLVPLFKSDNRTKSDSYSGNLKNTFSLIGR